MYLVVQEYGMVGKGVLGVTNLGDGSVTLRNTLGGAGVFTFSGSGLIMIGVGDVCNTLVGAPCLIRWA